MVVSKNKYKIAEDRFGEWPIEFFWYTRKKGMTIEEVIDKDLDWFIWAVCTFQNVTPSQAEYFYKKTGCRLNKKLIQDVTPYKWQKGDRGEMNGCCQRHSRPFMATKLYKFISKILLTFFIKAV